MKCPLTKPLTRDGVVTVCELCRPHGGCFWRETKAGPRERRSGRTLRMLGTVMADVIEHKPPWTFVIAHDQNYAKDLCRIWVDLMETLTGKRPKKLRGGIRFEWGVSVVEFISHRYFRIENVAGRGDPPVHYDHHVYER